MKVIGIETEGLGYNNQMRGIILTGSKKRKSGQKVPVSRKNLLKACDGRLLHPKNFESDEQFDIAVKKTVADYLVNESAPDFVVLPIDHAHGKNENADVDKLALSLKNAFNEQGISIKTLAMGSNLYNYQNVDIVHIGKHLLSAEDEKSLAQNLSLKEKVVETLGVPSNISWTSIKNLARQPIAEKILNKYKSFKKVLSSNSLYQKDFILQEQKGKKNVLFSLGGITDNGAIGFDIQDAQNLFQTAIKLKSKGYNVIFTNSPRTPSDVTDYLFEKCQAFHMDFYNSKKIAQDENEAKNFRNYNGKHKKEFEDQAKNIGNIYPAILNVCDFVVNTHDSFSYTSDAAALGIPSVVYTGNFIDEQRRPDCYKLFDLCHQKGYVISLDEAIEKINKGEKLSTKKMDDVSTQLVKAMKKSLSLEQEHIKKKADYNNL